LRRDLDHRNRDRHALQHDQGEDKQKHRQNGAEVRAVPQNFLVLFRWVDVVRRGVRGAVARVRADFVAADDPGFHVQVKRNADGADVGHEDYEVGEQTGEVTQHAHPHEGE
tara:strand:- start:1115 stop:1447 length:333 start_codon:yes stop_codon:yes gene_type:complete